MRIISFVVLLLVGCASMPSASAREEDEKTITAIIETWNQGWDVKDAKLAASGYSRDADWTNAFGMSAKGQGEIEKVLAHVFGLPFVMAANQSQTKQQHIRFLNQNVALVRTEVERTGQKAPDGQPMGTRHTHHLRVLSKTEEGWKIVSHLISDARDRAKPGH